MSIELISESRVAAAPHAHDRSSVDRIMLHVCFALLPSTLFGFYLFGWPATILFTLTCISAIVTEALCLWLRSGNVDRLSDGSALLSGWLLALTLPPWAPWWIGVGGSAFAVAIGKHLYGGIGQNVFNPAMLARVALLVSFPVQMTTWVSVEPINNITSPDFLTSLSIIFANHELIDGVTGPTFLGELKTVYSAGNSVRELSQRSFSWIDAAIGFTNGSLGETSELLVLVGGFWLLFKRIISWHIPAAMLLTTAAVSFAFNLLDPARFTSPLVHLCSGGMMLGAFFIATDYVTSPSSNFGKLIFGAGCALVVFSIRTWGGFPEGIGFGVLIMNSVTPLLDRYFRPRVYGRNLRGKAIKHVSARKVK